MKKPGDRVGRYIVEGPLGAGGMGEVYEARDTRLGRRVALKLLRSDAKASANQRLLREAQAAAAFEHPNAVVVYDAGEDGGEMYIAMELVRGRPLRACVGAPYEAANPESQDSGPAAKPPISLKRRLRWMVDVARALAAAHRAGLIHRDIKPDNTVVRDDGVIKVLDFGIARRQHAPTGGATVDNELGQMATVTAEGTIVGTPSYWAPEQLRGEEIDGRSDQFAWAVTVYELLTGAPPWTAPDPLALLSRILSTPPAPMRGRVADLPEEVEQAVLRALSKQPEKRFATMDEVADELEPFAASPTSQARGTQNRAMEPEGVGATTSPRSGSAEDAACCATNESAKGTTTPAGDHDSGYARQAGRAAARKDRWPVRWLGLGAAVLVAGGAIVAGTGVLKSPDPGPGAPSADHHVPLTVQALSCAPASLHGEGATPELAAAIGVGACARLATDLGVDWVPPGYTTAKGQGARGVDVNAKIEPGRAVVTVAVGDRKSEVSAATPMDALVAAAATLATQLAPPPMSAAEIAAWGGRDAAGARRVARGWRRMLLDFAPDDQAAARALLESDPESAWTHLIALTADVGGAEGQKTYSKRMIELAGALPPGRSLLLTKIPQCKTGTIDDRKEALRIMRQAYADAPDDADLVSLLTRNIIMYGGEEGFAVLDRLYERSPAQSVWPMMRAVDESTMRRDRGPERKYIERIRAVLPESLAWAQSVRYAARSGDMDLARRAVEMGRQLGATSRSSGSFYIESGRVWFALATLDPETAREAATPMLSVPRDFVSLDGSYAIVSSYMMEGRVDEAQSMRVREMERFRGAEQLSVHALNMALMDLGQRLLLGQPPPSQERLSWMMSAAAKISSTRAVEVGLWVALARMTGDPAGRRDAERALKTLEALIETESEGDPLARSQRLLRTIPAVQKLRGDADAVRRWKEGERADPAVGRMVAFWAAASHEAIGDLAGAEQAYKLAMDPSEIEVTALPTMAARVRLADLYRGQKRDAEAAALEAEIERVWAKADPGLRERIRAFRKR